MRDTVVPPHASPDDGWVAPPESPLPPLTPTVPTSLACPRCGGTGLFLAHVRVYHVGSFYVDMLRQGKRDVPVQRVHLGPDDYLEEDSKPFYSSGLAGDGTCVGITFYCHNSRATRGDCPPHEYLIFQSGHDGVFTRWRRTWSDSTDGKQAEELWDLKNAAVAASMTIGAQALADLMLAHCEPGERRPSTKTVLAENRAKCSLDIYRAITLHQQRKCDG